jgi:hypothetical protein
MKTYQVTFKSHSAATPFVIFNSENLQEAEFNFEKSTFDSFFSTELIAVNHDDDCSEIELRKYENGELTDFEAGESKLSINGGWIIKQYSIVEN